MTSQIWELSAIRCIFKSPGAATAHLCVVGWPSEVPAGCGRASWVDWSREVCFDFFGWQMNMMNLIIYDSTCFVGLEGFLFYLTDSKIRLDGFLRGGLKLFSPLALFGAPGFSDFPKDKMSMASNLCWMNRSGRSGPLSWEVKRTRSVVKSCPKSLT